MSENQEVTSDEAPVYTKEYVINYLIGTGVNSVVNSYNRECSDLAEGFVSLPLADISPVWSFLSERVKIKVLDAHHEEFSKWINSEGGSSE